MSDGFKFSYPLSSWHCPVVGAYKADRIKEAKQREVIDKACQAYLNQTPEEKKREYDRIEREYYADSLALANISH